MPNSMFTVTLKRSYPSTRHLAFGINNYKLGDRFAYENFDAAPNGVNANFFQLYVTSVSTTNVRTFSISYIVSGIDEISAEYQGLITVLIQVYS